jgi:cytoskeletal protein RodZ
VEEESTHQSRLFVILAIALIGLLVLGLLGIGGVFVIRQNLQQQAAMTRATPTLMIRLPEPTATFTPVKPGATDTPAPTPTNTPVLSNDNSSKPTGEEAAVGSASTTGDDGQKLELPLPASTKVAAGGDASASAAETPGTVPETGLGGLEILLIAMGLVLVLFVARRMRSTA